jgi:hypothetical protein
LLIAALRPDWWEDVQPQWAEVTGRPPRAPGQGHGDVVKPRAH